VGHAQYLVNTLERLGAKPELAPDLSAPPTDVRKMLQRDIEEEVKDVRHYLRLAELAEKAGEIELKLQMEQQAADEDKHRQEMRRFLG
jgi:bacterioferritin (cytochrome b1)